MNDRPILVAPSILAGDFGALGASAKRAQEAGSDWIHVDVMDGHFVPNITFGPQGVAAIRKVCGIPLDVHLMIERPDQYLDAFIDAGADILTVHVEADHDVRDTLRRIRARGKKGGIVLNPDTQLEKAHLALAGEIDLLLIMSVYPGFGGQKFIQEAVEKTREVARAMRERNPGLDIEIDGGITLENAPSVIRAGANVIVSGTTLFKHPDMAAAVRQIRETPRS